MRRVPGRVWLFWLALGVRLFSADFQYTLTLQKQSAYVHEPVLVTLDVWQTDAKGIVYFDFDLLKNPAYRAHFLYKKRVRGAEGKRVRFAYLLFAERAGEVAVSGRLVLKRTTESRLRHNNTGEPVKAKAIDTTDTAYRLPPAHLTVRALPADVPLVGEFSMAVLSGAKSVTAGEPIYVTIRVQGVGYVKKRWRPNLKIDGVRLFADTPRISRRYTREGLRYEARFSYALLAKRPFKVPALRTQAFSYRRRALYTLQTPPVPIGVTRPKGEPVDPYTKPASIYEQIARLQRLALYGVIFLGGYLTALLVGRWRRLERPAKEPETLEREIAEAKGAKELLYLLARNDPRRFAEVICKLERGVYRKERVEFNALKKEALRLL
ncbi:MAG: protein BatD [Epsilonproteobacteria bacterium]|nr:protein BatD [Campylobacterota bacterium]